MDSATTAAWVGAVGTWVIGGIAAWIATIQYRSSKFRPEVSAFREERGRILVRIANSGSGAGVVQHVSLLTPAHTSREREVPLVVYKWEIDGRPSTLRPVPFGLDGGATAQLFLVVKPSHRSLMNPFSPSGEFYPLAALRVRVDYGAGNDSGCVQIALTAARTRMYGTTHIPGLTLHDP